jgi:alkanesulfonate monooxygenase SsuD/methylene tetrahydromethanopterin reductase-like flavin-dependent oxidoreductase (luciferase family)
LQKRDLCWSGFSAPPKNLTNTTYSESTVVRGNRQLPANHVLIVIQVREDVVMRYGFVLPYGDARTAAEAAAEAEAAEWDGFFVWEPVWGIDAWVCLTAAAMRTERIRLGTMITPLSRMRPWKLASEAATLDQLSGGRVILSVGLGAVDTGFAAFGEVTDRRTRAELLDEGLEIVCGLWQGQPFRFAGKHYQVEPTNFLPPPGPVQQPRIPIWVVGALGSSRSMARVRRFDGLIPSVVSGTEPTRQATAAELHEAVGPIRAERMTPFDAIVEGQTSGTDRDAAIAQVAAWIAAGATWWLETLWEAGSGAEGRTAVLERIKQGPPRR